MVLNYIFAVDKKTRQMKKALNIALILTIALTSCKYEEGPGISLRSKRDRISNEWFVSSYIYTDANGGDFDRTADFNVENDTIYTYFTDGNSLDSNFTVESYSYVFSINRSGAYNMGVLNEDGVSVDPRKMASYVASTGRSNVNSIPDFSDLFNVGQQGEWSFLSKHSKVQFKTDNAGSNFSNDTASIESLGKNIPVIFEIIKLANDDLWLRSSDNDGGVHNYKLSPVNSEKYLTFNKSIGNDD